MTAWILIRFPPVHQLFFFHSFPHFLNNNPIFPVQIKLAITYLLISVRRVKGQYLVGPRTTPTFRLRHLIPVSCTRTAMIARAHRVSSYNCSQSISGPKLLFAPHPTTLPFAPLWIPLVYTLHHAS